MEQGGDESVRIMLVRMEGKLDLSNMRHDQTETRLTELAGRVHGHSNRIGNLEAREHLREGERKGLSSAGRAAWAAIGLIPGGAVVAALMKAFGA